MAGKQRIVLVHGWGASTKKLEPLTKELRWKRWQVFLPKLPGFDAPPPPRAWGVGDYASFVLEKSRKRFPGKKFFVFGHSFGGRITMKLASQKHPELSGIVLCAASGLSRTNIVKRSIFFTLSRLGKILFFAPQVVRLWRTLLYKLAREHDYENVRGVMREIFKKVIAESSIRDVQMIKVPTLVLWGDNDRMTPVKDGYYLKENLKNSKFKVYENEGHRLPYNQPDRVAEELTSWAKKIH